MLTIQHSGPDSEITTTFEYDGIQRLVRVTDTEGNVTTSTYDMGDRRTEVNHPASCITSFTYDALGNVLTKQTANLAKEGKFITYDYDFQRLTGINYPDHPENNVKYYYGGRNASQNRIGRLMLREDGTGAIEYFYGKMGEVTKTRRTMIVPNQAIATYVTQWTYDSHNRLLEMIYPDEEKITYSYNLGGQLEKVHGYKSYGYDYVSKIGYDKFEQRTYLKYCNGAETFYTDEPQCRTMARTTTTMWMARWCSISSMFLSVRFSLRSAITFGIRLIFFHAKEFDEETGLYYYGARYYEPKTSLWISTDHLQEKYFNNRLYRLCYKGIYFFQNILNSQYDFKDYKPRIFYHCFIFCFLELALLIQVWQHWPR